MPHQHEREKCARDRRTAATLAEIADEIHTSRNLVDAAFMAVQDLVDDERAPLSALLDTISRKLKATAVEIHARSVEEKNDAA